jgi:hypothetical protein
VVTPWRTLLSALGLMGRVKSECVFISMKPGATTQTFGIDHLRHPARQRSAERGDPTAANRNITDFTRPGAAVDQCTAADHDV